MFLVSIFFDHMACRILVPWSRLTPRLQSALLQNGKLQKSWKCCEYIQSKHICVCMRAHTENLNLKLLYIIFMRLWEMHFYMKAILEHPHTSNTHRILLVPAPLACCCSCVVRWGQEITVPGSSRSSGGCIYGSYSSGFATVGKNVIHVLPALHVKPESLRVCQRLPLSSFC